MEHSLKALQEKAYKEIKSVSDLNALTAIELKYLGRKSGELTNILKNLKSLPENERRAIGALANSIKQKLDLLFSDKHNELLGAEASGTFDVTEPYLPVKEHGTLHPITQIQDDLEDFFSAMGFRIIDGPELESDFYNFEALNIAADHPARDMQDTLYIKDHPEWLMRTHTSPMQVRAMREHGAPLQAIVPGRCFRNESTDARHEHTFHQLEGFVVGKDISFAHLKGILEAVAKHLYGAEAKVQLRPKYYPFVEPGVSGEVECIFCKGKGCTLCKQTGWLEIFGAGLIHPHVLKAGNLNPKEVSGLAFGFGLTRLAMLSYGVSDVRLFMSADVKFLKQF